MSDDEVLDEVLNEDFNEYSLMHGDRSVNNEGSVNASVTSASEQEALSKIATLADGQQMLIDALTQFLQAQSASLSSSSSSSVSSPSTPITVIQPTKVSDAQKINSLDWDHVVAKINEIDYLVSQQAPGAPLSGRDNY